MLLCNLKMKEKNIPVQITNFSSLRMIFDVIMAET